MHNQRITVSSQQRMLVPELWPHTFPATWNSLGLLCLLSAWAGLQESWEHQCQSCSITELFHPLAASPATTWVIWSPSTSCCTIFNVLLHSASKNPNSWCNNSPGLCPSSHTTPRIMCGRGGHEEGFSLPVDPHRAQRSSSSCQEGGKCWCCHHPK